MTDKTNTAELSEQQRAASTFAYPKNKLSDMLRCDRRTIDRLVSRGAVRPAEGFNTSSPVYYLAEVARALFENTDEEGNLDPSRMSPAARKAHYQAENERVRLEVANGTLIYVEELRETLGEALQTLVNALDIAVDLAERDHGFKSEQVEWLSRYVDEKRDRLYNDLIEFLDAREQDAETSR